MSLAPLDYSPPSQLWCTWQSLKGMDPKHLRVADVDLRGKNVLITGGNNGIGRDAALQFAKWGASVTLACRSPPPHEHHPDEVIQELDVSAKAAGHSNTVHEWLTCDFADLSSVESLAESWLGSNKPLDILINNCGMSDSGGKTTLTKDGLELVHQVNFMSHVLLTIRLLPSLEKAREPRIICTTSCMQYRGTFDLESMHEGHNAYAKNKLLFQIWLTELQSRLLQDPGLKHITVNGIHPGFVKTGIWNDPHEQQKQGRLSWVGWFLLTLLGSLGIESKQGSLAILNAATAVECGADPATQEVGQVGGKGGGRYFNRLTEEVPMPQTKSQTCRKQTWEYVDKKLDLERKGLLKRLGN